MAGKATKPRSKSRTRLGVNVGGNTVYTQLDEHTWEAYFALYDIRVTAESEKAVQDAVIAAIHHRIDTGTDEDRQKWQEFAQANIIEYEADDKELADEAEMRRKAKHYPSSGLPQLTPETFDKEVASPMPTLVDYWAEWCQPCHAMSPVLHELAAKLEGQLRVYAVDVEKHEELSERFDVRGTPTFIVFRDGQEVQRISGIRSLDELLAELEPVLG